jgi:hypothetical protein
MQLNFFGNKRRGGAVHKDCEEIERNMSEADQDMMRSLIGLAGRLEPPAATDHRAQFLILVDRARGTATPEARPVLPQAGKKRLLVLAGAAVLATAAATGVSAAGRVSEVTGNVQDVLEALNITDRTPDAADVHIDDIPQPNGAENPVGGPNNAGEHANDNAQHGLDTAAEGGENAGDGIQNASDEGLEHADDHALDGPNEGLVDPDGGQQPSLDLPDETVEPDGPQGSHGDLPDEANDSASERADNALDGADNGNVELPDEANDHAEDGGENAHIPENVPDHVDVPLP